MAQLAESQDATLLQRRARRRLVGAVALVVLVVIVLPILLDREPSPIGQDLVIQIPSQEAGRFNTPVLPPAAPKAAPPGGANERAPAKAPEVAVPTPPTAPAAAPAAGPAAAPTKAEKPKVQAEDKAVAIPETGAKNPSSSVKDQPRSDKDDSEAARAKALLEGKDAWVVRLGAFSNETNVKQLREKLAAAGVKSYTEAAKGPKGEQTRVRAGPFNSRLEAEKAQEKLKAAGVSPGSVAPR